MQLEFSVQPQTNSPQKFGRCCSQMYIPIIPSKYQKLLELRKLAVAPRLNCSALSSQLASNVDSCGEIISAGGLLLQTTGPNDVVPMVREQSCVLPLTTFSARHSRVSFHLRTWGCAM